MQFSGVLYEGLQGLIGDALPSGACPPSSTLRALQNDLNGALRLPWDHANIKCTPMKKLKLRGVLISSDLLDGRARLVPPGSR